MNMLNMVEAFSRERVVSSFSRDSVCCACSRTQTQYSLMPSYLFSLQAYKDNRRMDIWKTNITGDLLSWPDQLCSGLLANLLGTIDPCPANTFVFWGQA